MALVPVLAIQLELQRQQLLSDRQQFQRDQLKAAEVRSLQSPTLQPQTPLQLPPILRAPPLRSPSALKATPVAFLATDTVKEEGSHGSKMDGVGSGACVHGNV